MPGRLVTRQEWNALATAQRLELMLGRSLDDCWAVLEHPIEEALERRDAVVLSIKCQIIRAVLHTCTKLGIEHSRVNAERDKVLSAMAADLRDE
jgi:hypothetical protein